MRHVADGILDLPVGQRAAAPVGEPRALVHSDPEPRIDQVGIADLFGLADRHHRDLRVEDGEGRLAGQVEDDLHVLPAGMENLQAILVLAQQVEQRSEVDPVGHRVDGGGFLLVPDLHQAQFGVIGVLAHEFGIDADEIALAQPFTQVRQRRGCSDKIVNFH